LGLKVKRIELKDLIQEQEQVLEQDIIVTVQDQDIRQDTGAVKIGRTR